MKNPTQPQWTDSLHLIVEKRRLFSMDLQNFDITVHSSVMNAYNMITGDEHFTYRPKEAYLRIH